MEQSIFARDFVLILFTAFAGGITAKKLKMPLIVGYLVAGIISGSVLFKMTGGGSAISSIAEIGIALLLFTLGLEFSVTRLKEMGEVVIFGSLIQVLLTTVFCIFVFPLIGMDFYTSLFLGAAFSLSSTAAVLKNLSDKGELETLHGEMSAGWLFMQDLYTLPIIIILPTVGKLLNGNAVGFDPIIMFTKTMLIAFGSFFLILFFGKKIIPVLFEKIADLKSRELIVIAAMTLCLLFAYFFQLIGISYAVGAFVAGILLSSSSAHHGIFAEIRPLRDLFATVFFVSLGFILNPAFIFSNLPLILFIVFFIFFIKFIISAVLVVVLGYHTKTAVLVGFSLISVGEFAFIIALLGLSTKLIDQDRYLLVLSVTFISLILSMPVSAFGDKVYYFLKKLFLSIFPFGKKIIQKIDYGRISQEKEYADHVVVLGHGRVGKYICRALALAGIPFIVIDYNHHLVKVLREQGIDVIYGDPAEIDVLKYASVGKAKTLILAYSDRHTQETVITNALTLNPTLTIICRTHFEEDQKKLKSLGVFSVIQPEYEAALIIAEKLLRMLLNDNAEVAEKLAVIRKEHG